MVCEGFDMNAVTGREDSMAAVEKDSMCSADRQDLICPLLELRSWFIMAVRCSVKFLA